MSAKSIQTSEFEAAPNVSAKLWIVGALGAVMLHAGGFAWAFTHMQNEESENELGAPAIEIGLELLAPRAEVTDLPPGPEVEASVESPAVVEQKMEVEQTNLPKAVAVETDDPDRLVAPEESKVPKEDEIKMATAQAAPSAESIAAEATAAPASEVIRESTQSVAPVQGIGESAQRIVATWQKQLVAHLDKHKRYPTGETQRNVEIVVAFVLNRSGNIVSANIIRGSGSAAFDEAALSMMRRSDPVPSPPPVVADDGLSFTLPVLFRAKGSG